jgi:carbonic anhydrase
VVRLSIANMMSFPWIAQAVASGRLEVQGYIFDIHNGVLSRITADSFEPVE